MSIYNLAGDFVKHTNRCLFITGKAGTGKTTFLQQLRANTLKQMAVVAPTGVAAINAGGVTIHSFFQLPFTPFLPTPQNERALIAKLRMNSARRKVMRDLELLVIDEISMVRADVLDAIDAILRGVRRKWNKPFGGVQVIFIGDMYQLSPVAKEDEWQMLSAHYRGIYFFHSKVVEQLPPLYIEFDKIFRQSDDRFIRLLNEVRNDCLSAHSFDLLQSRYDPSFVAPENDVHITLTTHNYKADQINNAELAKINKKIKTFDAEIKGDFSENSYPTDKQLELKVGAKVMFVKNDTENPRRYYNGKIGTITQFNEKEKKIYVKPAEPNEDVIEVMPVTWENIRYSANETTLHVEEEVIGTFIQYPLRLAWAITIHKSQGLTFDKAIIDAGASFSPGQVYVALSRCRSLEGITLLSRINRNTIKNDDQVVEFSSQPSSVASLQDQFETSQRDFRNSLMLQLFNFTHLLTLSKIWHSEVQEQESSYGDDALPFIRNVIASIVQLEDVGEKFRKQLAQIVSNNNDDATHLLKRLQAASSYFIPQIESLLAVLQESPASTDSKKNANQYDERLKELYTELFQKKYFVKQSADGFTTEKYFDWRHKLVVPPFRLSSYSKSITAHQLKSSHPDLLTELIALRNDLADEFSLPVYVVANKRTLEEMSEYLPRNKKDMLRIYGMGATKYERFGEQFLEIVNRYADMNDLSTRVDELSEMKSDRKSKTTKGASAKESLAMWQNGLSIKDIAAQRGLVEGTIASHLSQFVVSGDLDIHLFVAPERMELAQKKLAQKTENASVYATLSGEFNPIELTMLNAFYRKKEKEASDV